MAVLGHSFLYYPNIEFQAEDYQSLWNAALFADKIYRIVPPNYELSEPRNIKALCSTDEIGIPISPVPYAVRASQEFCDFMDRNQGRAAALSLVNQEEIEYTRIHDSKMDVKLLQDKFYDLKKIDEENWFYGDSNTINFYMTFLANLIAKKNNLTLWTGNQELWTASTYFLCDGDIQDGYWPEDFYTSRSQSALISLMIPDIFPQNLIAVPPEDILQFREKRKHERIHFLDAIDHCQAELKKADSPDVVTAILKEEKAQVDVAMNEYRKSMDILKVVKFGGILTTVLTIAVDALGYMQDVPDLFKGVIGSSGLWAGILTGILGDKATVTNNPYTYLAHINSSFSLYPGADNFTGLKPKYNYTLYRGFEEFIND